MAYLNNYVTTSALSTSAVTSNTVILSGLTYAAGDVDYDSVRQVVKKKDEFAWLRGRVDEVCWRHSA